jgi:hypothetical protein
MSESSYSRKSVLIGIVSFFIVLFTMPLGHAAMILMENFMEPGAMHIAGFALGAIGFILVIIGVFVKGDTKQTFLGLIGGLLFWTGWVEFIFVYYTHRYGMQPVADAYGVVTKPEYLMMPASFGFWIMFLTLYLFSSKTGCDVMNFLQRVLFKHSEIKQQLHPMTRHTSIITFMEFNIITWTSYLFLLFCYDDNFLGDRHPITALVAVGCLVATFFMVKHLLKIRTWGYSIRYSIATVVVFWSAVEIIGRWGILKEIWLFPVKYRVEMIAILIVFILLIIFLARMSSKKKKKTIEYFFYSNCLILIKAIKASFPFLMANDNIFNCPFSIYTLGRSILSIFIICPPGNANSFLQTS